MSGDKIFVMQISIVKLLVLLLWKLQKIVGKCLLVNVESEKTGKILQFIF